MNKDEWFIFTTLSSMGIDIDLLQEKSKAVSPPHHINFFNPSSIEILLKNCGFSNIDVSTPGKLDMDILKKNVHQIANPLWKKLIGVMDEDELSDCQTWIQKAKLSSHMMVWCQKK